MSVWVAAVVAAAVWVWLGPSPTGRHRSTAEREGVIPPQPKDLGGRVGPAAEADPFQPVPAVELASVAELLALVLGSGIGVSQAIETVADTIGGILGRHLRVVCTAHRWGLDEAEAWARLPAAWQPVARALQVAAETGIAPADMLQGAADDLRRAERHRLELATARLGVRVVLPLGLAFLPSFALTTVVPVVLALGSQVLTR